MKVKELIEALQKLDVEMQDLPVVVDLPSRKNYLLADAVTPVTYRTFGVGVNDEAMPVAVAISIDE